MLLSCIGRHLSIYVYLHDSTSCFFLLLDFICLIDSFDFWICFYDFNLSHVLVGFSAFFCNDDDKSTDVIPPLLVTLGCLFGFLRLFWCCCACVVGTSRVDEVI